MLSTVDKIVDGGCPSYTSHFRTVTFCLQCFHNISLQLNADANASQFKVAVNFVSGSPIPGLGETLVPFSPLLTAGSKLPLVVLRLPQRAPCTQVKHSVAILDGNFPLLIPECRRCLS